MESKFYFTDDTALAAYLYLCGMEFMEVTVPNADDPRRKNYIIYDSPERKKLEEDFFLRRTVVAPLDYHDARVRVSRFLKHTVTDVTKMLT